MTVGKIEIFIIKIAKYLLFINKIFLVFIKNQRGVSQLVKYFPTVCQALSPISCTKKLGMDVHTCQHSEGGSQGQGQGRALLPSKFHASLGYRMDNLSPKREKKEGRRKKTVFSPYVI